MRSSKLIKSLVKIIPFEVRIIHAVCLTFFSEISVSEESKGTFICKIWSTRPSVQSGKAEFLFVTLKRPSSEPTRKTSVSISSELLTDGLFGN